MINVIYSNVSQHFFIKDFKKINIKSCTYFINYLLKINLISLKTYTKYIKENTELKYNLPIYLNKSLLLFECKTSNLDEKIYLNFFSIIGISEKDNKTQVVFNNGDYFFIDISLDKVKKQMSKCNKIIEYLNMVEKTY